MTYGLIGKARERADKIGHKVYCLMLGHNISDEAKELKDAVSGEHEIGHAKQKYLEDFLDDTVLSLMQRIKSTFDPHGMLNPQKVIFGSE